jgi:hypothetical protein
MAGARSTRRLGHRQQSTYQSARSFEALLQERDYRSGSAVRQWRRSRMEKAGSAATRQGSGLAGSPGRDKLRRRRASVDSVRALPPLHWIPQINQLSIIKVHGDGSEASLPSAAQTRLRGDLKVDAGAPAAVLSLAIKVSM